jgi:hypothetical protein
MSTPQLDRTSPSGDLRLVFGSLARFRDDALAPPLGSGPRFAGHRAPERADAR